MFGLNGIAGPAISEYRKLPGYRGVISQNTDSVVRAESAIRRLYVMKDDVAHAVSLLSNGTTTAAQQSNLQGQQQLSDIKQALIRLLPSIANEGQVAAAESDTVDAINNAKYIGDFDIATGRYKPTSLIGQCERATGMVAGVTPTYVDEAQDYFPFHYYALPGFPTYNMSAGPYPSTIGGTVYRRVYPGLSNYPTTPSPTGISSPYTNQDINTFMPHQRVADSNDSDSANNQFMYYLSTNFANAIGNIGIDFGGLSFRYFEDTFNVY